MDKYNNGQPILVSKEEEIRIRKEASKFKEEYLVLRKKLSRGEELNDREFYILEKGDDYLIAG